MKTILIRHGLTAGNREGRYIGCRTDEPLCPEGRRALAELRVPAVRRLFVSPMKRAVQTAEMLYPGQRMQIVDDLRECDFGAFEGKNHAELNGRADYQAWIDSGGEMPFPGGESRAEFAARCVRAYEAIRQALMEDCAVIAHGGTLMAIMERFARPRGGYFDFQVKNGAGFILYEDGSYERL